MAADARPASAAQLGPPGGVLPTVAVPARRRLSADGYHVGVANLRLFASAREAAGTGRDVVPGTTVREVLEAACGRYGHDFAGLLEVCQVWCNGEPAAPNTPVRDDDEIAVLPPVSGG